MSIGSKDPKRKSEGWTIPRSQANPSSIPAASATAENEVPDYRGPLAEECLSRVPPTTQTLRLAIAAVSVLRGSGAGRPPGTKVAR
jgi:hypothetical protein